MANHIISMSNYPGNSTADLRTWGANISNGLTQVLGGSSPGNGNFVASTINWSTITLPGTTNTTIGYEVWKLNDPSHASASPVYMKFTYRTGSTFAYQIFITINVSTGWDGTNITGPGSATNYTTPNYTDGAVSESWMSSDGDGFVWFNAVSTNTNPSSGGSKHVFVVDRQRNPNGLAQANTGWPNTGFMVGASNANSTNPTSFGNNPSVYFYDPVSNEAVSTTKWPIITRSASQASALSGDGTKTLVSPMWNVNRQGSYISKMVLSIPRNDVNAGSVVNIDFLNATRQYKSSSQYSNNFGFQLSGGDSIALWWGDV